MKSPQSWRGRTSRDDLMADDPFTMRETLLILGFIGMLAAMILVGIVCFAVGAMR